MMYSSIEENQRKAVIQNCYWPLLNLAELGFPIGLEAPGITLEIINELDSTWIDTLANYIEEGKIEFIGSGYSQIIGPLVPSRVNDWNQRLGLDVYKKLLNVKPDLALINEMAFSAGIVEHYINNGYKAIIMEWNNPKSDHPEWENEWRYFAQRAKGCNDLDIPVVWADSIAFQKFQRYVHGEYSLEEYLDFLRSHMGAHDRYFPLYSNDVEIFDFRPGRYHTEASVGIQSEWKRVIDLYKNLKEEDWCEVIRPSAVLEKNEVSNSENLVELQSPAQPIPVKKQPKYNIIRWALTGRDDLEINTQCYKILDGYKNKEIKNKDAWKKLCFLWSSDFRTHITQERWDKCQTLLEDEVMSFGQSTTPSTIFQANVISNKNDIISYDENEKYLILENDYIRLTLNKTKGMTIKDCFFKDSLNSSVIGTLDHGYFENISLGNDYYSGHAIIERFGAHKITDLGAVTPVVRKISGGFIVESTFSMEGVIFDTAYIIEGKDLKVAKKIKITEDIGPAIIRPITLTLLPEAWDLKNLSYMTHNGGKRLESFELSHNSVIHNEIYTGLISAHHGLGATEGKMLIKDAKKKLQLSSKMHNSAMLPLIIYQRLDGKKPLLRVQYSAKEIDETDKRKNKLKDATFEFELNLNLC
jgi:hypothetical protein